MARRFKRQPRVVWLPQDPFFSADAATTAGSTVMRVGDSLPGGDAGNAVTVVAPVIRDTSPNPLTAANTLADINESGYRLRRIVGKIWVGTDQVAQDSPAVIIVTAAFIILRTDPGAGASPQNPAATAYAANDIVNTESPWIWRRSWLVRNFLTTSAVANAITTGFATADVGGNADGPHVDQKTARIVGPDERLFLVFTATSVITSDAQLAAPMSYFYDVRVLASMRSNVGNRRNASR